LRRIGRGRVRRGMLGMSRVGGSDECAGRGYRADVFPVRCGVPHSIGGCAGVLPGVRAAVGIPVAIGADPGCPVTSGCCCCPVASLHRRIGCGAGDLRGMRPESPGW